MLAERWQCASALPQTGYTLKFLPARSVTVRLDAVGYRRSTKEQKGVREKEVVAVMVESETQTGEEEEKDPNIRVPSYKQGG